MSELTNSFKQKIKKNAITKPLYLKLKEKKIKKLFKPEDIRKIYPVVDDSKSIRINLILPLFREYMIYAGVTTALTVFEKITKEKKYDCRIIITGPEKYNKSLTYRYKDFSHESNCKNMLYFLEEDDKLLVRKNDYFIFTDWQTAYSGLEVIDWQIKEYNLDERKYIYLIQDYEPGFYSWSTPYIMADATYKIMNNNAIAVFNSKELYDFFKNNKYAFGKEFYFEPGLNNKLKQFLINNQNECSRDKAIIIYGRPNSDRNAFTLIINALKIWSSSYKNASEWKIYSLGDQFETIIIENNKIEAMGKLTLDEYASIMLKAYVGISLMISPHPSYPPLEMSTFGVEVITNSFANKDLTDFSSKIHNIKVVTPQIISDKLSEICDSYVKKEQKIQYNDKYVFSSSLESTMKELSDYFNNYIEGETYNDK
jgi:hypothetical protein